MLYGRFVRELDPPMSGRCQRAVLACVCLGWALLANPAGVTGQNQPLRTKSPQYSLRGGRADALSSTRVPQHRHIASLPKVQDVLEVIHHRSQMMVMRSRIVRTAVADPSIIDVVQYTPNELAIVGLAMGSTTVTFWFENDSEPLIYLIKVIRDPSVLEQKRVDYGRLERKLAILFPNSTVYLIPLSRKIVVKGQARDSGEAARILSIVRDEVINQEGRLGGPQPVPASAVATTIGANDLGASYIVNMLEVPGEFQIMLHVRIAELNRSMLRRMGVDMNYLINGGRHAVAATLGGLPSTLTGVFENGEISVLVNWLASNGTAKILAEPTLTVLSGHSASFLAGGEFAVPTIVGVGGAQGTSTTFRGFGTSLIVSPIVLDKDLIRLRIVPEFSQVNQGNAVQGIPGVDSRRVQTTVELREGQTIVVGGLFSHTSETEVSRIPVLGELPVIGPILFNTKLATQDETELLILVTPEIVRPLEADEVPPVPGFYVTNPGDKELYRYAMTEGAPDTNVYQLAPYGRGVGHGLEVGYRPFNPAPASPQYAPVPTAPHGVVPGPRHDPARKPARNVRPTEPSPGPPPSLPASQSGQQRHSFIEVAPPAPTENPLLRMRKRGVRDVAAPAGTPKRPATGPRLSGSSPLQLQIPNVPPPQDKNRPQQRSAIRRMSYSLPFTPRSR